MPLHFVHTCARLKSGPGIFLCTSFPFKLIADPLLAKLAVQMEVQVDAVQKNRKIFQNGDLRFTGHT